MDMCRKGDKASREREREKIHFEPPRDSTHILIKGGFLMFKIKIE